MFKTIVWATDGSESADAALPYAKSLAVQNGAALVVVHAVEHIVGRGGGYLHVNEDELQAKIERQTAELKEAGLDVRSTSRSRRTRARAVTATPHSGSRVLHERFDSSSNLSARKPESSPR
jgi:nucleotide-binding universal stress UspA family protein